MTKCICPICGQKGSLQPQPKEYKNKTYIYWKVVHRRLNDNPDAYCWIGRQKTEVTVMQEDSDGWGTESIVVGDKEV